MTPAELNAYLDSPEGRQWLQDRHRTFYDDDPDDLPWIQAPGDCAEDPCGRGAETAEQIAAREAP